MHANMIGFHVSKKRGKKTRKELITALREDITELQDYGFDNICVQVFVAGPRQFRINVSPRDAVEISTLVHDHTSITLHGTYLDRPWSMNRQAISSVREQLRICDLMHGTGVVVHLSNNCGPPLEGDPDLFPRAISAMLAPDVSDKQGARSLIWLEIHAAKPTNNTFETPEKLAALFARVPPQHRSRVGLCIDTAHLASCGVLLNTYQAAREWIETTVRLCQEAYGDIELPYMFHLNDSKSKVGSGVDRHEKLFGGVIWSKISPPDSGVAYILQTGKICILERNDEDIPHDLKIVRHML